MSRPRAATSVATSTSNTPFRNAVERALAVGLRQQARQRYDLVDSACCRRRASSGGHLAGRGEHEALLDGRSRSRSAEQQVDFLTARRPRGTACSTDSFTRDRRVDPHGFGMHEVALGERADLGGKRRGEEQRLAAHRNASDDRVDVVDETHVEHAVGSRPRTRKRAAAAWRPSPDPEEIEQPPRRRDEQVAALRQLRLLPAARRPAVGEHRAQTEVLAEPLRPRRRPDRQLARRADDDRMRLRPLLALNACRIGRRYASVFPVPVCATPDEIVPAHDQRDRLRLDRRRTRVAGFVQRALDLRREARTDGTTRSSAKSPDLAVVRAGGWSCFAAPKMRSTRSSVGSSPWFSSQKMTFDLPLIGPMRIDWRKPKSPAGTPGVDPGRRATHRPS